MDAKIVGGGGHQLHESAGAGAADGVGVAAALGFDDAGEQIDVEIVFLAGAGQHFAEVGLAELGVGACGG